MEVLNVFWKVLKFVKYSKISKTYIEDSVFYKNKDKNTDLNGFALPQPQKFSIICYKLSKENIKTVYSSSKNSKNKLNMRFCVKNLIK